MTTTPRRGGRPWSWLCEHSGPVTRPRSGRSPTKPYSSSDPCSERIRIRSSLMIALVKNGSRNDIDDFLDLARGKDPALAAAAIRALTLIGDPRAVPFLAKIARTTPSNSGLLALDALTRWPDSADALET